MPSIYYGFCHRSRTVVVRTCLIADDDVRFKCHELSFVSCELVSLVANYVRLLRFGKLFRHPFSLHVAIVKIFMGIAVSTAV